MFKQVKQIVALSVRPARFTQEAWRGGQSAMTAAKCNPIVMRALARTDRRIAQKVAGRWAAPKACHIERAEVIEYLADQIEQR